MRPEQQIEGQGQRQKIDHEPRANEKLRFINGYRAVVLFGRSGVGQSNAGEALAKRSGALLYDAGKEVRGTTGNTPGTIEYMMRPVALDTSVDNKQRILLEQASPENPVVIVAKRGGYNALVFEREDPENRKVAKILVICERDEAAKRIYNRFLGEFQKKYEKLREQVASEEITFDEYQKATKILSTTEVNLIDHKHEEIQRIILEAQNKESRDRMQWAGMYPETEGLDIYDPSIRIWTPQRVGRKGIRMIETHLYDFHLATTHHSKYQSINYIVDKLIKMGIVETITPADNDVKNNDEVTLTPGDMWAINQANIAEAEFN